MLLYTAASNLRGEGLAPEKRLQVLAIVLGSILGTIVAGHPQGPRP